MKRYSLSFILSLTMIMSAVARGGVGLVLSGGGAKGVAHIGVIKALEENDIPIDYIAGTSMGAIVGSLYAAGYTPDEMMELLASDMFQDAAAGKMDPDRLYLFYRPTPRPSFFTMTASTHDSIHVNSLLPSSLISPMPMNFAFIDIYAPATIASGGDFDRLMVPFRCVASDMTAQKKLVWSHGALEDAVRSSMTFPVVFHPVERDGALLYDGGIYDNFPVDVMRADFAPDIMIGVDVHASEPDKSPFPNILTQLDYLVMRPSDYSLPDDEGIYMRVNLNRFSLLDFAKSPEICKIGYDKAMEMMDSIKQRIPARRSQEEVASRREAFRKLTAEPRFASVKVTGGTAEENKFIESLFESAKEDSVLSLDGAYSAYSSAISTGQLTNISPRATLTGHDGLMDLNLKIVPKGNLGFALGGYITSSSNSMLYLQAGYNSLSFRSLDASLGAWLGQNYMAGALKATYMFRSSRPSAATFLAVAERQRFYESDKLFYDTDSPAFIRHTEFFTRLSYGFPTARSAKFDLGIGFGHLRDSYYNNDYTVTAPDTERNRLVHNLGQIAAVWELNTLNAEYLPTSGRKIGVMAQGLLGDMRLTPGVAMARSALGTQTTHCRFLQLEANYRDFFPVTGKFTLGIESTLVASTRHLIKNDYNASVVAATAFRPTAASYNVFNPSMRANSFITAGVAPIYKFSDMFSARGSFHAFVPWRPIEATGTGGARYGDWFSRADFYGEISGVLTLPFASLSVYGNYQTIPGNRWGVGVSFGVFILAPRFLRL